MPNYDKVRTPSFGFRRVYFVEQVRGAFRAKKLHRHHQAHFRAIHSAPKQKLLPHFSEARAAIFAIEEIE
jgi:hypothetical protein